MRFRLVARAKNKQKYLYQYLFCPWNNFLSQISHGKIANVVRFSFEVTKTSVKAMLRHKNEIIFENPNYLKTSKSAYIYILESPS